MNKILLINGPNMNLLGKRQVHLYGTQTLEDILIQLKKLVPSQCRLIPFQNNIEGEIVNFLNAEYIEHDSQKSKVLGIIINASGYSHTSIAIRDALEVFHGEQVKIYEVHMSQVYKRENFRQNSFISSIADGVVYGFGAFGYEVALQKILKDHHYV